MREKSGDVKEKRNVTVNKRTSPRFFSNSPQKYLPQKH